MEPSGQAAFDPGSPPWGQHRRVGLLSYLVAALWGLNFSRSTVWGRGHSLGGLFHVSDSTDCSFLKQEEEEQGEEGGDGAAGDPKKEKKSLDSDESEDEEDDYQVLGLTGAWDLDSPIQQAPVV